MMNIIQERLVQTKADLENAESSDVHQKLGAAQQASLICDLRSQVKALEGLIGAIEREHPWKAAPLVVIDGLVTGPMTGYSVDAKGPAHVKLTIRAVVSWGTVEALTAAIAARYKLQGRVEPDSDG